MNSQIDVTIPILTEVIAPDDGTENDLSDSVLLPRGSESNGDSEQYRKITAEEWQQLEQTLRENVLRQVLSRIDFVLEHRVRDSLADVLQLAVENLANEIRQGLNKTLEDVVTRAINQEIAKIKSVR
jgi:hypothetical protein